MDKSSNKGITGKVVVKIARRFEISVGLAYVIYDRFLEKYPNIPEEKNEASELFLLELEAYENEQFSKIADSLESYGVKEFFHITHVINLINILNCGLKAKNLLSQSEYKDISNPDIQRARAEKNIPFDRSKYVHDYVPLFIAPKPPMQYVLKEIQDDLIYLHINCQICGLPYVIFTDGNARNKKTKFYDDWQDLSKLDWDILRAKYWSNDQEEIRNENKRKRSAEVLVPEKLSPIYIESIGVLDDKQLSKVKDIQKNSKYEINVFFDANLRID